MRSRARSPRLEARRHGGGGEGERATVWIRALGLVQRRRSVLGAGATDGAERERPGRQRQPHAAVVAGRSLFVAGTSLDFDGTVEELARRRPRPRSHSLAGTSDERVGALQRAL